MLRSSVAGMIERRRSRGTAAPRIDPLATAKRPQQQRAVERFEGVLATAETLLRSGGLRGFSIPAIAHELGCTRGSIYAHFPTAHAVLNELAVRYLGQVFATFAGMSGLGAMPWREGIRTGVHAAASFYDAHPVARMLVLGGAVTDAGFRAQELTVKQIADLGRLAWKARGIELPSDPDVAALAIDLGMACFRRSVFAHGAITARYREAAADVMVGYLEPFIERPATAPTPKGRAR
jgi:AcrR family transcriptional regulator